MRERDELRSDPAPDPRDDGGDQLLRDPEAWRSLREHLRPLLHRRIRIRAQAGAMLLIEAR